MMIIVCLKFSGKKLLAHSKLTGQKSAATHDNDGKPHGLKLEWTLIFFLGVGFFA